MWENRVAIELDQYIDSLLADVQRPMWPSSMAVRDLTELAGWLRTLLLPVEPSPIFREALHTRLLAAAKATDLAPQPSWQLQHRRELIIGAAVGSAISLAGIAAVIARLRWVAHDAA